MTHTNIPNCNGACCRNQYGVCYHKHECAHHQVDEAVQKLQDELSAAAEISRYDRTATKARVR